MTRPLRNSIACMIEPDLWNPPGGAIDFISSEIAKKQSLDKADAIIAAYLIRNPALETEGAARIMDIMMGGDCSWRTRINDSDFLESSDWQMALAYARAAQIPA